MDRRRPRNPPARPLVLLVEHHEDTRALYALTLSVSGFEVIPVADGTEANRRACEIHPDIIVTDLQTSDGGGWEFLHELKRNPRTRDIPIVAVSGSVQSSVRDRAAREGCVAFFSKPCLPVDLVAGLRQVLQTHGHAQGSGSANA